MKTSLTCLCGIMTICFAAIGAELTVSGKTGADIQTAIDKVASQGGGRVIVSSGEYISGTIYMKSNVELHLEKGATIKGSTKESDYNKNDVFPENFWSNAEEWSGGHLILGYKVENVSITGEGVIDGNGPAFFGECDEDSRWPWYKYGLKLHPTNRTWFRPGPMLAFFLSKNIRFEGVSFVNTPGWTCHVRCSDGLTVKGVTIDADRTIANSDGFSIDCTRNVLVEDCKIYTGDDSFAIRAACKLHAKENFCENIRIKNCDMWSCCYGIRFGIGSGNITNIVVENSRIHEASHGFGFTPAWVKGERNCFIEDITVKNCIVSDCVHPVEGGLSGNSKVDNIRFEDCVFNTLLPVKIGKGCGFTFERCQRNAITRYKVRHRLGWNEKGIRAAKNDFIQGGAKNGVKVVDCSPLPLGSAGILLLAFDDRNFNQWEKAMPIFKKYNAHASFFVCGAFDEAAVSCAKKLMADGHTIGLHGAKHINVTDAFEKFGKDGWWDAEVASEKRKADVAYVPVKNFAYPNNKNNSQTDEFLLTRFDRLRTGVPGVRPFDPDGKKKSNLKPLVTNDSLFFPAVDLPNHRVLGGVILGDAYNNELDDVLSCVRRAGERKEVLLFTSHGISPGAKLIDLKTEWLEKILETAKESGVLVLGFDDLP